MSTLLSRAPRAGRAEDERVRPRWQAALIGVTWSVGSVLVPLQLLVLLGWVVADTEAGPRDALVVGANGWLLGHGVPIPLADGTISLHPLGLLLLVLAVLFRAGCWAARVSGVDTLRDVARLVASIALIYGAVVAAVAAVALGDPAQPTLVVAAGAGVLIALLASGCGALRGADLGRALRARVPMDLRVALDAGAGAVLVLLAGAAIVLAASLVVHGSRAVGLSAAVGPGVIGWPLLLVLNLLLAPNAVVYALSYTVGPGFTLGAGTSVSLGGTEVGPLPSLTLLAGVPEGTATPVYAYAVLFVPLLAGVTAGLLAVVRAPGSRAEQGALRGLYAGLVAGVTVGLLAWGAGGALGSGNLATLGPNGWLVGAAVAAQVGVIGAVTAWVACPRPAAAAHTGTTSTSASTCSTSTSASASASALTSASTMASTSTAAAAPASATSSGDDGASAGSVGAPAEPPDGELDAGPDGGEETIVSPRQAAGG